MLSFTISNSEGRGRDFYLANTCNEGIDAIREEPYAFVVFNSFSGNVCSFCCGNCTGESNIMYQLSEDDTVKYCSEICVKEDYRFHKFEVEVLKIFQNMSRKDEKWDRIGIDRLRLLFRIAAKRKSESESERIGTSVSVYHSTFCDVLSLQSKLPDGKMNIEEDNMLSNQVLSKLSKLMSMCKLPVSISEARHLLSAIRYNAHCLLDRDGRAVALGLFPRVSMLNHSCVPNCTKYFSFRHGEPPQLVIRSGRLIPAGEALTYSYVPLYQSTTARRSQLLHCYGFTCQCARCNRLCDSSSLLQESFIDAELSPADRTAVAELSTLLGTLGALPHKGVDPHEVEKEEGYLQLAWAFLDNEILNAATCSLRPQHRLLLQLYVCGANLTYRLGYGEKAAMEEGNRKEEGAERESSRQPLLSRSLLRRGFLLGLLALGCLYAFLGPSEGDEAAADKEMSDIETIVGGLGGLCLQDAMTIQEEAGRVTNTLADWLWQCAAEEKSMQWPTFFQRHEDTVRALLKVAIETILRASGSPISSKDAAIVFNAEAFKEIQRGLDLRAAATTGRCRGYNSSTVEPADTKNAKAQSDIGHNTLEN